MKRTRGMRKFQRNIKQKTQTKSKQFDSTKKHTSSSEGMLQDTYRGGSNVRGRYGEGCGCLQSGGTLISRAVQDAVEYRCRGVTRHEGRVATVASPDADESSPDNADDNDERKGGGSCDAIWSKIVLIRRQPATRYPILRQGRSDTTTISSFD